MDVRLILGALVLVGLASSGCHDSNGVGPSGLVDGSWTGSIVDSAAGTGTAVLTMSQRGAGVSGTWSVSFADARYDREGTIGGTRQGFQVSLFLTPASGEVCGSATTLSGTLGVTATTTSNRLTGTYAVLTCDGARSGTLDLRRD